MGAYPIVVLFINEPNQAATGFFLSYIYTCIFAASTHTASTSKKWSCQKKVRAGHYSSSVE